MNYTSQIAKHLRDLHFGGNWTAVNMKDTLSDVDWKQAAHFAKDLKTLEDAAMNFFSFISL